MSVCFHYDAQFSRKPKKSYEESNLFKNLISGKFMWTYTLLIRLNVNRTPACIKIFFKSYILCLICAKAVNNLMYQQGQTNILKGGTEVTVDFLFC